MSDEGVIDDLPAIELSCVMSEEVLHEMDVIDDLPTFEFSCDESEEVLSDKCVSDIQHEIELSCGLSDEVLFDECVLECDSDEHFYDGINCDSGNESVMCVENICDVDEINVLNKCENVKFVCENENSAIKNGDYELKNDIEGFVSNELCVKKNRLPDVCIPL